MTRAGLELANVSLTPPKHAPLMCNLSLQVSAGTVTTIMGPSGIGKSALLSFICGTLAAGFVSSGQVTLNGRDLTGLAPEDRAVGILFQDDLLFPHLSVGDNLLFALNPRVRPRAERRERIDAALEDADLGGWADRDPATLSGGQRARIALLRTLLSEPQAVLLDEPFSKLDQRARGRIRDFVFSHIRRANLPTLLVTHDEADAAAAGGALIQLTAS